jgi:GntR family transcriptional regulator of arabinose operon
MFEQPIRTSKYILIADWLKAEIEAQKLRPGDKVPSESEICERFKVSRSAVRQAIASLVNEGWLETRKGIGTFCLPPQNTSAVDLALVCYKLGSYIFPQLAGRFGDVAQRNGFHMLLNETLNECDKERAVLQKLRDKPVAGIAIEPAIPCRDGNCTDWAGTNYDLLCEIQDSGIPVVLLDNNFGDDRFPTITMNNEAVGRTAARHLIAKGHRLIGAIFAVEHQPFQARVAGLVAELRAGGLPVDERWFLSFKRATGGKDAIDAFFASGITRPSAFFCANDEIAIDLYKAADAAGLRIPEDLSILSVDNSQIARLPGINLSSIDYPGNFIGEKAAQILIDEIVFKDLHFSNRLIIEPALIERSSVRELRGGSGPMTGSSKTSQP